MSNGYTASANKYKVDWLDTAYRLVSFFANCVKIFLNGIQTNTVPWEKCFGFGIGIAFVILTHRDYLLFRHFGIARFYPKSTARLIYDLCLLASPFVIWTLIQTAKEIRLKNRLKEIFLTGGLKTALGRLPQLKKDTPLDDFTRKLQFDRTIFPLKDFEKAKSLIEGGLRVYIDELKESREKGTVDVIYSRFPMPSTVYIKNIKSFEKLTFLVGNTRTKEIKINLRQAPHLLVAGQTGGGKSTFLRQLITTLYLNNKNFQFSLIDLKGGLEFQLFEDLPRVEVISDLQHAVQRVKSLAGTIEDRMAFLKENSCKDIDAYHQMAARDLKKKDTAETNKPRQFNRHMIVVDEAAEIFLAGDHGSPQDIQQARRVLSQIARQGRSVGVNLVVATQRPDTRSLDPQIKANLIGTVCFQMPNDASSITVLGNGRATDLPAVPGRAIWKCGAEQMELQTPYLSDTDVENLFESIRKKDSHDVSDK